MAEYKVGDIVTHRLYGGSYEVKHVTFSILTVFDLDLGIRRTFGASELLPMEGAEHVG